MLLNSAAGLLRDELFVLVVLLIRMAERELFPAPRCRDTACIERSRQTVSAGWSPKTSRSLSLLETPAPMSLLRVCFAIDLTNLSVRAKDSPVK